NGGAEIDRSNNDVSPQGRDGSLMGYMFQENNRAVIDDGVYAGELTEESDQDGHDQGFSECGIQQIPALFGDGGPDRLNLSRGRLRADNLRQKLFRFLLSAFLHQPPRAFRNEKQRQEERNRENGRRGEHPSSVCRSRATE